MSDHDIERLCAGYRATVQDPPYDPADAALIRAAARRAHQARRLPVRRVAYGIAATLLAALGLAAGMRSLTFWHRPSIIATRATAAQEARPSKARTSPFNDYLTNAMLGSASTGFLQETSAVSTTSTDPTCGTAAAIDLNAPGALASLKTTKPADYGKIMHIIAGLTQHPELDVARWISATFHAGNVSYLPLWLTSLPPQRRLSFCLGSTSYGVVLTITGNGARVSPRDYYKNSRKPLRMRQLP
ncbi:MAG: hypothetical protein WBE91_06135 [Steroidobacteraceae bacterium]